jgi:hypothetical protein
MRPGTRRACARLSGALALFSFVATASAQTDTTVAPPVDASGHVVSELPPVAAPLPLAPVSSEAPAARAPAQAAASDSELDAAELEKLLAAQEVSLSKDEPTLSMYGFADASITRYVRLADNYGDFPPRGAYFGLGNLNLYAAANLTHGFTSLIEIRFTYLPNGNSDATGKRALTEAGDYADWGRPVRWGGIVLERAHLDYSYNALLNVRFGVWLTPYGVWNVDHGSPAVIPVIKPYMIGEQLFPERQTGLQLFGTHLWGSTTLGYHLTLSNGRGDVDTSDFDRNKALGARLYVSTSELGQLTFGVSGYGGTATRDVSSSYTIDNKLYVKNISGNQYKELSLASDVVWEWNNIRVQGELVVTQVAYMDPVGRQLATNYVSIIGLVPDHVSWGSYGLLGYRLPWLGTMPFVMAETYRRGYADKELLLRGANSFSINGITGGINVRPVPQVVFKGQVSYGHSPKVSSSIMAVQFQAAWAF